MKNNKGITLVALVVTIVVLLILAGVSINLVLGDNGIVKKAQDAKTKSAEASENDLKGMNGLVSEMEGALAGNGSTGNGNTGSGNNFVTKNTEVTYPGGNVWIPEGFRISKDSASTVQNGVVIEDKDGNQFVWVPVATLADYKRRTWYTGNGSFSDYSEALPEDERASVDAYKGFYIGRYEAGDKESTGTTKATFRTSSGADNAVTIKADQVPYNFVTRTQAVSLAEGFATKQGYKAKTKLVSSYAWDTTIAFIEKTVNNYGSSSSQGNYSNTSVTYKDITDESKPEKTKAKNSSLLVATGQTTPVCNIYDMGGNLYEWTTESDSRTYSPYAVRGGDYNDYFAVFPAGNRYDGYDGAYDVFGFRLTLFM